MNNPALKARYRRILRFASLALAELWWFELFLPQIGLAKLGARGRIRRLKRLARKFHDLAADLGGLMVKVGQFLSARLEINRLRQAQQFRRQGAVSGDGGN